MDIDAPADHLDRAQTYAAPEEEPYEGGTQQRGGSAAENRHPVLPRALSTPDVGVVPHGVWGKIHRAELRMLHYAVSDVALLLKGVSEEGEELLEGEDDLVGEERRLLERRALQPFMDRWREWEAKQEGLQDVGGAAVTFLRSMIGTAVLYLPRIFLTGGLLFSSLALLAVASICTVNMCLLSHLADETGCTSYGGVGRKGFGRLGQALVNCMIVVTQVGWVPGYIVFVQQNLSMAFPGLEKALHLPPVTGLVVAQLVVLIPLSWIRHLRYLGLANLFANGCVLAGLAICLSYSAFVLAEHGGPAPYQLINTQAYALMLGSTAVTFEGMSLVLPIKSSMRKPELFEPMVCVCMVGVAVLYWTVGALGYLAFGSDTQTFITNNLPASGWMGPSVRVVYALAVLLSYPLQLFPATTMLERILFRRTRLKPLPRKVAKNAFRTCVVLVTCVVAVSVGQSNVFDNFVALIGAVGSVPLGLILPPLLSLKILGARTRSVVMQVATVVVGVAAMALCLVTTIATW